jgi:ABC-type Na+ efflux pump permease subunit
VLTFPLARALHLKEYRNGYYVLPAFFLASLASAFLTSAAYLLSDVALVFFMVGMDFTWRGFLLYALLLVLGSCIGAALGFLMGVLTSDIRRVQQVRQGRVCCVTLMPCCWALAHGNEWPCWH